MPGGAAAIGNIQETSDGRLLITTGSGAVTAATLEDFLQITSLDNLDNGTATEGSGLRSTPIAIAEDATLTFSGNFLTNESAGSFFNDFAFAALAPAAGMDITVNSLADTNTPLFPGLTLLTSEGNIESFDQQTGTTTFTFTGGVDGPAGDYILVVGVTDVQDNAVTSGLLIDAVTLDGEIQPLDVVQTADPDLPILGSSAALILRAGVAAEDIGNPGLVIGAPGAATLTPPFPPVDIETTFTATPVAGIPVGSIQINGNVNTSGDAALAPDYVQDGYTAGPIVLSAAGDIEVTGTLTTRANDAVPNGSAGSVTLQATGTLTLADGLIIANPSASGQGNGGNVTLQGSAVTLRDYGIDPAAFLPGQTGNSGNITLLATAADITLTSDGFVRTLYGDTVAQDPNARGGNILLDAPNGDITVTNYRFRADNGGIGAGGDITLQAAEDIRLSDVELNTNTLDRGSGGDITLTAGGRLAIAQTTVTAENSGTGQGGSIELVADQTLIAEGSSISTNNTGEGIGGSIAFNSAIAPAESVTISDAQVSVSTSSPVATGISGDISLYSANLTLDNSTLIAETEGAAAGGIIDVNTEVVTLQNDSILSTSASADGDPGNVLITADTVTMAGNSSIEASNVASGSGEDFLSVTGNIVLDLNQLTVSDSLIAAETVRGEAGNIVVEAANSVQLSGVTPSGPAGLRADAGDGGQAGSIRVMTPQLTLDNGAAIAVSGTGSGDAGFITVAADTVNLTQGQITATTEAGSADAAGIQLQNLQTLTVNQGQISASTTSGIAGGITVNAAAAIRLTGNGGIRAAATAGGSAGNIALTTRTLAVSDGAEVSVSSPSGVAGSLNITAPEITLDRGSLNAIAGQGDGGANILLTLADDASLTNRLTLRNESLISANAQGTATGGNITIDADFVLGEFPTGPRGSDIVANAELGNGGLVTINALGIFGLQFRLQQTPLNDITANSAAGLQGTVELNTLTTDPNQGLAELTFDFIDATDQTTNQCDFSAEAAGSAVRVLGRGGWPVSPTTMLGPATAEVSDWVTLPSSLAAPAIETTPQPVILTARGRPAICQIGDRAPALWP